MKTVTVEEAQATLPALLAEARAAGAEVVLTDAAGEPVARLAPLAPGAAPRVRRVAGEWRAYPGWENFVFDPALFAPMTEDELIADGWDPDLVR